MYYEHGEHVISRCCRFLRTVFYADVFTGMMFRRLSTIKLRNHVTKLPNCILDWFSSSKKKTALGTYVLKKKYSIWYFGTSYGKKAKIH